MTFRVGQARPAGEARLPDGLDLATRPRRVARGRRLHPQGAFPRGAPRRSMTGAAPLPKAGGLQMVQRRRRIPIALTALAVAAAVSVPAAQAAPDARRPRRRPAGGMGEARRGPPRGRSHRQRPGDAEVCEAFETNISNQLGNFVDALLDGDIGRAPGSSKRSQPRRTWRTTPAARSPGSRRRSLPTAESPRFGALGRCGARVRR